MKFTDKLKRMHACPDAIKWASNYKSLKAAWNDCDRADWMLWVLAKTCKPNSTKHRKIILAACAIARTGLRYIPKDEKRPLRAIQVTEAWAKGKQGVALEDVRRAAYAVAYAAYAVAYAAYSVAAVAYAADAVVYAANAAYAADTEASRKKNADIVRKYFPNPPGI